MKTPRFSLLVLLLAAFFALVATNHAQTLINVQFAGNDFNSTVSDQQIGAGLVGTAGDEWNYFLSTSALTSGVSLNNSSGASSGVTLTVSAPYVYQYSVGAAGTSSGGSYSGANQLGGTPVGNLTQGELGAGGGQTLTLSLTGLAADTDFTIYLYSNPDRWERASSWSINGGSGTTVGPLNNYTGPYAITPGYAPYVLVEGINYLVLSGTSDGAGTLTFAGTGLSGAEPDINGFQIQSIPEPATYVLLLAGLGSAWAFRRRLAN